MCSCGGVQNTRLSSSIITSGGFSEQSRELPTADCAVSVDVNCTHMFLRVRITKKWQEGFYKAGKEDGTWNIWHENGKKKMEVTLELGELISQYCWDAFGNNIECN